MDQEKIGKLIKEIRIKNHLTQKELADKYGVTYQAVSKWENGKNLPDVSLIKQMSKDFNINIEDILEGELTSEREKNRKIGLTISFAIIILLLLIVIGILWKKDKDSFEFKTISSNCDSFNISGSMAYNKNKSSIYISNVNYCGGDDDTKYKDVECVLYESHGNTKTSLAKCDYDLEKEVKLEEFLENVKFNVDNYARTCNEYKDNHLYLEINATDFNNKTTSYKVPLNLEENCSK